MNYVKLQNRILMQVCDNEDSDQFSYVNLQRRLTKAQEDLITAQKHITELQQELLSSKSEQIEQLQTSVKSSVESSVKAEFVSYSNTLQNNLQPAPVFTPRILKSVVKTVSNSNSNRDNATYSISIRQIISPSTQLPLDAITLCIRHILNCKIPCIFSVI